jgi:dimethylargininase
MYRFNRALVRAPARSVVNGLSATGAKPSFDGVAHEHTAYITALRGAGVVVDVLPPLEAFPDSLFVEDTALVFTGAAIVLRPGAPTRNGEVAEITPQLAKRFRRVLHLEDGFVDGGDVLATPRGIFIGLSSRTDAAGAKALAALLAQSGLRAIVVTTPPGVLHFKSDSALIDDETILATGRLAASGVFAGFRTLIVPEGEDAAANALRVNDRLLLSEGYPRTHDLLAESVADIVTLPTREIAKIDAGLSCMSLRWQAQVDAT